MRVVMEQITGMLALNQSLSESVPSPSRHEIPILTMYRPNSMFSSQPYLLLLAFTRSQDLRRMVNLPDYRRSLTAIHTTRSDGQHETHSIHPWLNKLLLIGTCTRAHRAPSMSTSDFQSKHSDIEECSGANDSIGFSILAPLTMFRQVWDQEMWTNWWRIMRSWTARLRIERLKLCLRRRGRECKYNTRIKKLFQICSD